MDDMIAIIEIFRLLVGSVAVLLTPIIHASLRISVVSCKYLAVERT